MAALLTMRLILLSQNTNTVLHHYAKSRPLSAISTHTRADISDVLCSLALITLPSHYLGILIHTLSSACTTKESLLNNFQRCF